MGFSTQASCTSAGHTWRPGIDYSGKVIEITQPIGQSGYTCWCVSSVAYIGDVSGVPGGGACALAGIAHPFVDLYNDCSDCGVPQNPIAIGCSPTTTPAPTTTTCTPEVGWAFPIYTEHADGSTTCECCECVATTTTTTAATTTTTYHYCTTTTTTTSCPSHCYACVVASTICCGAVHEFARVWALNQASANAQCELLVDAHCSSGGRTCAPGYITIASGYLNANLQPPGAANYGLCGQDPCPTTTTTANPCTWGGSGTPGQPSGAGGTFVTADKYDFYKGTVCWFDSTPLGDPPLAIGDIIKFQPAGFHHGHITVSAPANGSAVPVAFGSSNAYLENISCEPTPIVAGLPTLPNKWIGNPLSCDLVSTWCPCPTTTTTTTASCDSQETCSGYYGVNISWTAWTGNTGTEGWKDVSPLLSLVWATCGGVYGCFVCVDAGLANDGSGLGPCDGHGWSQCYDWTPGSNSCCAPTATTTTTTTGSPCCYDEPSFEAVECISGNTIIVCNSSTTTLLSPGDFAIAQLCTDDTDEVCVEIVDHYYGVNNPTRQVHVYCSGSNMNGDCDCFNCGT
jgi:hypothetical protein